MFHVRDEESIRYKIFVTNGTAFAGPLEDDMNNLW